MAQHIQQNWLKDCTEQLDLPGSPWYDVKEHISKYMVDRIRIEGLRKDELAKVRYLLGKEFMSKYKLIRTEKSSEAKRPNLTDEKLESLLKDVTLKAAKDAGCFLSKDLKDSPESFRLLIALFTRVIESSLESCINATKVSRFTQYGSNTSIIALNSFVDNDIEILGEAVTKILQKEPSRIWNISHRLQGRLLPVILRRQIYRLMLINKQKETSQPGSNLGVGVLSSDDKITQQGIRERFAKDIKQGALDLKLKDPTKSPLRHLIRLAVIEAYETLPGLKSHSKNIELQKECSTVLNLLYTHSKKFHKTFILWAFPLQVTISQDRFAKEHSYELAMWLNCLIKSCVFTDPRSVNAVVLNVWKRCFTPSSSLFLKSLYDRFCEIGVNCDLDSVKRVLEHDPLAGTASESNLYRLLSPNSLDSSVLSVKDDPPAWTISHPVLCIRQWVMDLFVGSTDFPVTMYLWDQFFLHSWEPKILEIASCCLIYSMSDALLHSTDVDSLCATMLERAVDVKLYSIQQAFIIVSGKYQKQL